MAGIAELFQAIDRRDSSAVRQLLGERPELVEAKDKYGLTPLMHAASCMTRTVDVISAILEAGANVNRQSSEGYTALHCAIDVNGEANLNAAEVIATLISACANLKLRQHYGWTPLLCAVVTGGATEVKSLLQAGADPNETMPLHTLPEFNAGRTTLMGAITNPENEKIVEALLNARADPLRLDEHGMNFFEYVDLVQRESGTGDFSAQIDRCAKMAREWLKRDA